MRNYRKAEMLKYRHTFLCGVVLLMPVVSVVFAAVLTGEYFVVDTYNWWYIGLYPGMIGIVCGMIGGKDKKKKNFTLWSLPCEMGKIWDAKIFTGAFFSGLSVIFLTVLSFAVAKLLGEGLHIEFLAQPSAKMQILAGIVLFVTTLWQVPFCLFLSQKIGSFPMFLVHMGSFTLMSTMVSLKPWYMALPGGITSRLMCPLLGILPNGLLAREGAVTYSPEFMESWNLPVGVLASLIWFFLFFLGSRKWFERQVEK